MVQAVKRFIYYKKFKIYNKKSFKKIFYGTIPEKIDHWLICQIWLVYIDSRSYIKADWFILMADVMPKLIDWFTMMADAMIKLTAVHADVMSELITAHAW